MVEEGLTASEVEVSLDRVQHQEEEVVLVVLALPKVGEVEALSARLAAMVQMAVQLHLRSYYS